MEIIIAAVALAAGFTIGFLLIKGNRKSGESELELTKRQEEREQAYEKELNQRLADQKALYVSQMEEKERSYSRELELLRENHQKELQNAADASSKELEIVKESFNSRLESAKEEKIKLESDFKQRLDEQKSAYDRLIKEQNRRHEEALQSLGAKFDEKIKTAGEQLKTVTADMLKERQQEFSESSRERISQILDPLQNSISEMRKAVTENTTRHSELGGQLDAGIKTLLTHTVSAQASAEKLATALRGGNKIQGNWGETILKNLLESQGLTEGIHFDTQTTITDNSGSTVITEDGAGMRPDVILHLDKGRELIIDSKVSLTAYLDYLEADNDESRNRALNEHIRSIQNHVKELSKKDYSKYIKSPKVKLDYVIMFVPNTSALMLATTTKTDLWRKAMADNVYIADEQTLYAALRIIEMTWTQIAQAQNQERVFELAGQMVDRVENFLKSFNDIGAKLKAAQTSFESAEKKLMHGGHSIPQTARRLLDMGTRTAKQNKNLDSYLSKGEFFDIGEESTLQIEE